MVQCIVHGLGVSVLPPLHSDSIVEACNQTPSGHKNSVRNCSWSLTEKRSARLPVTAELT